MRLVVKQDDVVVNEYQFTKGPIYIGRHTHSQVFLADRKVSRQHAVIFATPEGKWVVEDLDSVNKTYLNDEEIHKAEIQSGEVLRIASFSIEVTYKSEAAVGEATDLEDTLSGTIHEPEIVVRKIDAEYAPDIKMPSKRAKDYFHLTEAICKANGLKVAGGPGD